MKLHHKFFTFVVIACSLASNAAAQDQASTFTAKDYPEAYQANWDSLAKHGRAPEWFADAKLGIYFHWGPYTVPGFRTEWYPRWMHMEKPANWGAGSMEYHKEHYGDPSEFGYHHFIPMFTGEHFDPADWAELFASAGAKFAGPVAQHHDGFSMWASKINPNNAKVEGPKRDILGELFGELRKRDMKTIATFHHSFTGQRHRDGVKKGERNTSYYPYNKDYFTSSEDPKLRKLYGNMPEAEFNDYWLNLVQEVVDTYSPDMIWFDSWLDVIPEDYRQRMAAHHFNATAARGEPGVLICKQDDMPDQLRVLDIEQGGMKEMPDKVWMTDITLSLNGWCHVQNQKYKSLPLLVRNMVDVWSKRGVVLLNISPRADGVIPDNQRELLHGLGDWLEVYGEAVYGTRHHHVFGYGDATIKEGHHGGQSATIKYTASDIRFTRSADGKAIYVFFLGQPEEGSKLTVRHLAADGQQVDVKDVSLLGSDAPCQWQFEDGLLKVVAPQGTKANEIATVYKVSLK